MRTRDKTERMNSEGEQEKWRESRGWRNASFLSHRFASECHLGAELASFGWDVAYVRPGYSTSLLAQQFSFLVISLIQYLIFITTNNFTKMPYHFSFQKCN